MLGQKGGRTCVCAARAVTSGCVSGKWLGALASSAMPAASRPVGGLNGSQTGQAPAQFVRKTPAVCAAAASSDRGPRLAADSGACFRTRVELAGALPSPFGLGGASCGARGFKATAVPRKEKDLYKLLDVQRDASASDIKKAYFKMVGSPPMLARFPRRCASGCTPFIPPLEKRILGEWSSPQGGAPHCPARVVAILALGVPFLLGRLSRLS